MLGSNYNKYKSKDSYYENSCFKQLVSFLGMEACGTCKAVGDENMSEAKVAEVKAWAAKFN